MQTEPNWNKRNQKCHGYLSARNAASQNQTGSVEVHCALTTHIDQLNGSTWPTTAVRREGSIPTVGAATASRSVLSLRRWQNLLAGQYRIGRETSTLQAAGDEQARQTLKPSQSLTPARANPEAHRQDAAEQIRDPHSCVAGPATGYGCRLSPDSSETSRLVPGSARAGT